MKKFNFFGDKDMQRTVVNWRTINVIWWMTLTSFSILLVIQAIYSYFYVFFIYFTDMIDQNNFLYLKKKTQPISLVKNTKNT